MQVYKWGKQIGKLSLSLKGQSARGTACILLRPEVMLTAEG